MEEDRYPALVRRVLAAYEPILLMRLVLAGVTLPSVVLLRQVDGVFLESRMPLVAVGTVLISILFLHDLLMRRMSVWRLTWTSYLVEGAILLFGAAADSLVVVVATLLAGVLTPLVNATVVGALPLATMCMSTFVACYVVVWAQGDALVVLLVAAPAIAALLVAPSIVVYVYRMNLERAVRQAHELARTDALTGLLNRRGMSEAAPEILARARQQRLSIGVLVADVDHFKRINDEFGHVAGDEVLTVVADTTRGCVRPHDLVVRLGGEEIAVIAVIVPRSLTALAERVRMEVEHAARRWGVTVSVGVAWSDPGAEDDAELLHTLLDRADELMYAAKRAGRNQVRLPV